MKRINPITVFILVVIISFRLRISIILFGFLFFDLFEKGFCEIRLSSSSLVDISRALLDRNRFLTFVESFYRLWVLRFLPNIRWENLNFFRFWPLVGHNFGYEIIHRMFIMLLILGLRLLMNLTFRFLTVSYTHLTLPTIYSV